MCFMITQNLYFWLKYHEKGVIDLKKLILLLIIIGGVNWGLIGFFNFNLVSTIFGGALTFIARIIYALVGIAALYSITFLFTDDRKV